MVLLQVRYSRPRFSRPLQPIANLAKISPILAPQALPVHRLPAGSEFYSYATLPCKFLSRARYSSRFQPPLMLVKITSIFALTAPFASSPPNQRKFFAINALSRMRNSRLRFSRLLQCLALLAAITSLLTSAVLLKCRSLGHS